jgi:hypothetical protein
MRSQRSSILGRTLTVGEWYVYRKMTGQTDLPRHFPAPYARFGEHSACFQELVDDTESEIGPGNRHDQIARVFN